MRIYVDETVNLEGEHKYHPWEGRMCFCFYLYKVGMRFKNNTLLLGHNIRGVNC